MAELERYRKPRRASFQKSQGELLRGTVRDRHEILFDEPPDMEVGGGDDAHPSPVDYMFASLVGCQLSVLNQCLEKARVEGFEIEADARIDPAGVDEEEVTDEMPSNTRKRIRHIEVDITLTVPSEYEGRAARCLEVYDAGCIVGQSFRAGIEYTPETHLEVAGEA